jgi:hypothetical protein
MLGIPVSTFVPDLLAELIKSTIKSQEMKQWVGERGLILKN